MAQFSLAWILNNPAIISMVRGANSIKQLEVNIRAVAVTMTGEDLNVCDEVWYELRPPRF